MKRCLLPYIIFSVLLVFLPSCTSSSQDDLQLQTIETKMIARAVTPSPSATIKSSTLEKTQTPTQPFSLEVTEEPIRGLEECILPSITEGNPLLLYTTSEAGILLGSILNTTNGKTSDLADNLLPIRWSPSGKKLLLTDRQGPSFYVSDQYGNTPVLVWSVEEGDAAPRGWWVNEEQIIVAEFRLDSTVLPTYVHYLLDLTSGTASLMDPSITWDIKDVAPNGSFWVENRESIQVVFRDGSSEDLWVEGDVIVDIPLFPTYVSIAPDSCSVVFLGCNTKNPQDNNRACGIYEASIGPNEVSEATLIFTLGESADAASIQVSPNNRFIGFVSPSLETILVISKETGDLVHKIAYPEEIRSTPQLRWGPNSSKIAITYETPEGSVLIIYDLVNGTLEKHPTEAGLRIADWRYITNPN